MIELIMNFMFNSVIELIIVLNPSTFQHRAFKQPINMPYLCDNKAYIEDLAFVKKTVS